MRFTWVALPVLLATLAPASGGGAVAEEPADDERSRTPVVRVTAETDPSPVRPWTVVDLEVAQPSQGSGRRHLEAAETIDRGPSVDGSSSESAHVHLRVMRVASLDFSTRISHSLSGFLPSYSTACPPPAA